MKYCPRCGSEIWFTKSGEGRCPSGAAYSVSATVALADLKPQSPSSLELGPPSTWYCPACGKRMYGTTADPTCASCGRSLSKRLLYQLVEFNPHEPAFPKVPMTCGLVAYWITRPGTGRPIGVTGHSLSDALRIAKNAGYEIPESINVADNVRPQDLDPRHILPNAGPLIVRGVWYPRTSVGAGT
jgi:hypothetical protein